MSAQTSVEIFKILILIAATMGVVAVCVVAQPAWYSIRDRRTEYGLARQFAEGISVALLALVLEVFILLIRINYRGQISDWVNTGTLWSLAVCPCVAFVSIIYVGLGWRRG